MGRKAALDLQLIPATIRSPATVRSPASVLNPATARSPVTVRNTVTARNREMVRNPVMVRVRTLALSLLLKTVRARAPWPTTGSSRTR